MNNPKELTRLVGPAAKKRASTPLKSSTSPLTTSNYVKEGSLFDPQIAGYVEALHPYANFWVKIVRETRMISSEVYLHNFATKCIPD